MGLETDCTEYAGSGAGDLLGQVNAEPCVFEVLVPEEDCDDSCSPNRVYLQATIELESGTHVATYSAEVNGSVVSDRTLTYILHH